MLRFMIPLLLLRLRGPRCRYGIRCRILYDMTTWTLTERLAVLLASCAATAAAQAGKTGDTYRSPSGTTPPTPPRRLERRCRGVSRGADLPA